MVISNYGFFCNMGYRNVNDKIHNIFISNDVFFMDENKKVRRMKKVLIVIALFTAIASATTCIVVDKDTMLCDGKFVFIWR